MSQCGDVLAVHADPRLRRKLHSTEVTVASIRAPRPLVQMNALRLHQPCSGRLPRLSTPRRSKRHGHGRDEYQRAHLYFLTDERHTLKAIYQCADYYVHLRDAVGSRCRPAPASRRAVTAEGHPRSIFRRLGRPLPVTVPVTSVTPSRAQREPAPVDRIATSRVPPTGTVNEADRPEARGALRLTHWLAVSQARIRASPFPQNATLAVNDRDGDPGADERCRQESRQQPASSDRVTNGSAPSQTAGSPRNLTISADGGQPALPACNHAGSSHPSDGVTA
jgi:hypothetical protein